MPTVKQLRIRSGLPNEMVRIIYPAIGGAFGGREDMSMQIVLALAAWKLKQPVKTIWSRRESMIGHGKRHAVSIKAKWGATKDGKLIAAENELIGDGGAYMYTSMKVLGNPSHYIHWSILRPECKSGCVRRLHELPAQHWQNRRAAGFVDGQITK